MADMAAVLGEAGGCPVVEHDGVRWHVGHPVQRAKKLLEDAILDAVENDLLARREANPAAFRQLWDDHRADKRAGRYATVTGDLWWEAVSDPRRSGVLLLTALLRCHHPDATPDDAFALLANRPEETEAALGRVLPDFFEALLADPRLATLPPAARGELRAAVAGIRAALTPSASPP